jgi:predicted MFS family arabinose efflux permease
LAHVLRAGVVMSASALRAVLVATALMALVMGSRSAFGLFLSPLNSATGIGLAGLSFALALGQLAQGFAQPALGWWADRLSLQRMVRAGAPLMAAATFAVAFVDSVAVLAVCMVVLAIAGTAVGSSNLLMAEVGRRVPAERRAQAFGLVSAGGSAGQMLFGPATQLAIDHVGWIFALLATAAVALLAWPLAGGLGSGQAHPDSTHSAVADDRTAVGTAAFWLIAGSYAVCGFHIGYFTTHMPGAIERCGLTPSLAGSWLAVMGVANIGGSLWVAWWLRRHSSRAVLTAIYGLRGASVAMLLFLPPSPWLMLVFAVLMGLSYMALLPAISQQVVERFGLGRVATLFGIVALVHQAGSSAGVWLGGVVAAATGRDAVLWAIDIGLALAAMAMQWGLGRTGTVAPAGRLKAA